MYFNRDEHPWAKNRKGKTEKTGKTEKKKESTLGKTDMPCLNVNVTLTEQFRVQTERQQTFLLLFRGIFLED